MMRIFIFITFFSLNLVKSWAGDPLLDEFIKEARKQYEELVKFNEQNRKNGITGENLYIFSVHPEYDFSEKWVAYRSINEIKDENGVLYSEDFLKNLNNHLNSFNARTESSHEIYVCLVSGYKVYLKTEIGNELTTQQDVLSSLEAKYHES